LLPLQSRWPVILSSAGWDEYRLVDFGHGRKLERYGAMTIVRPELQALGAPRLAAQHWDAADAVFTGDVDEEGAGRWRFARPVGDAWTMLVDGVRIQCRFTAFRHVGLFPEQIAHWSAMAARIRTAGRPVKVLNLFGYTGVASLIAAQAGAAVTHVDASKKAIAWARENQALAGLTERPIRWICEDAAKFVAREVRRGSRYDIILVDPPTYGRGPNGEVWDLFRDLGPMLSACRTLLSETPLDLVLTVYAMRASFVAFHELMADIIAADGGVLQSGELMLTDEAGGRSLSTSLYCRWQPGATP
jgi:23S rRNA (cytosine1962-C5)-methyltransferase